MLRFCPLASGSKGNALFIGTEKTRILIDAGLSPLALEKRLAEIGVELDTIDAILITHEHTDHIKGIATLASEKRERRQIPIFANAETAKGIYAALQVRPRFKIFTTGETFLFGDLKIHPFTIPHDTLDPVAFRIEAEGARLGICADLGHATSLVKSELKGCGLLYLEANHEPARVHACARPAVYKERVLSKQGHLSNQQCAELLTSLVHEGLRHVHLAHLSSECNSEELALQVVGEALEKRGQKVELSIAYQDRVSKEMVW